MGVDALDVHQVVLECLGYSENVTVGVRDELGARLLNEALELAVVHQVSRVLL